MGKQKFIDPRIIDAFEERLCSDNDICFEDIEKILDFYMVYPYVDKVRPVLVEFFNSDKFFTLD